MFEFWNGCRFSGATTRKPGVTPEKRVCTWYTGNADILEVLEIVIIQGYDAFIAASGLLA